MTEAEPFAIPTDLCRTIVDNDAYGRVVIDANGFVQSANQAAADLIGRSVAEMVGAFLLDFVAEADHATALEGIHELQDRIPREAEGIAMVFGITRPDGTVTHVEVGADNYLGVDGLDVITLRVRPYDGQYYLQRFLRSLLVVEGSVADYHLLVSSVDHTVQSARSALCTGWDGACFASVTTHELPLALCGGRPPGSGPDEDGRRPWAEALASGDTVWASVDELPRSLAALAAPLGLRALWAIPMDPSPGSTEADSVILVWRRVDGPPKLGHRAGLARIAAATELAFEHTAHQHELRRAATLDALTGLPNRGEFFTALCDEADPPSAVLFLDLDGFKAVNDVLGHRFGDHLLRAVADVLALAADPGMLVARLGGDEFGVLVRTPITVGELAALAVRLVEPFAKPFAIEGQSIRLGLSVGVADGASGLQGEALLDAADRALYQVKRNGKGGWALAEAL